MSSPPPSPEKAHLEEDHHEAAARSVILSRAPPFAPLSLARQSSEHYLDRLKARGILDGTGSGQASRPVSYSRGVLSEVI